MKHHIRIDPASIKEKIFDKKNKSLHYYDEHGNEIYMKRINPDGQIFKRWTEWKCIDNSYAPVHMLNSYGHEEWYEYNNRMLLTHLKKSTGFELWKEYDELGVIVHYRDSNGKEEWFK